MSTSMYNLCKIYHDKYNNLYVYHPINDSIVATNNKKITGLPLLGRDLQRRYYFGHNFKRREQPLFYIPVLFEFIGKNMDKLVPVIIDDCIITNIYVPKVNRNFITFK